MNFLSSKGMKVADLKAILQQANVAFDSKLTKPGLIKKIMETPEAAALASGPDDDDVVSRHNDDRFTHTDHVTTLSRIYHQSKPTKLQHYTFFPTNNRDWDRGAKAAAATSKIPASTPAVPTPANNPVVKATPTREPPSTPAAGVPASSPKPMDGLPPSGEASVSFPHKVSTCLILSLEESVHCRAPREYS